LVAKCGEQYKSHKIKREKNVVEKGGKGKAEKSKKLGGKVKRTYVRNSNHTYTKKEVKKKTLGPQGGSHT